MKKRATIIEVSGDKVILEASMKDVDIIQSTGYKCFRVEIIKLF